MRRPVLPLVALLALAPLGSAGAAPLLMISIDGLRPGDLLEAPARGLRLPSLTGLVREGAWATGVRGVLPTVTYPSHATLITGVWPSVHGIANNTTFDPLGRNQQGWYWYAEDLRVPTLWQAAHAAGRSTASVRWPTTVGARGIDTNLPQLWRSGQPDDAKLIRAVATPELVATLERAVAPLPVGAGDLAADQVYARYAEWVIENRRPQLCTVYLGALDEAEHDEGPGSAAAQRTLEALDGLVGRLVAAARRVDPRTTVAVVSDHGFVPIERDVHLTAAFARAGLLGLDEKGQVTRWEARPWQAGGSSLVVLARPDDQGLRQRVGDLLARLAADPENGVATVLDAAELVKRGGSPQAAFWVSLRPGFSTGGESSGPLLTASRRQGMHGYLPDTPGLLSTFVVAGPEVPRRGSLGEIDMRDIAPTLAALLKVKLPSAEGRALWTTGGTFPSPPRALPARAR